MFFKMNNVKANFVFAYFIAASLAQKSLRVTRCRGPVRWSGQGLCTLGSPLSSATMCSPLIPSSRIQLCPPTQPPTPSPSWRRRAGGLRKRGGSLEHCRLSRGEKTCSSEDFHAVCLWANDAYSLGQIYLTMHKKAIFAQMT